MKLLIYRFKHKYSYYNIQIKYLLSGVTFGFIFPIIAVFIEMYRHGKNLKFFSVSRTIIDNPLLIMISTAPFFLGIFSLYAGINHAKIIKEKEKLSEIADLLYEKSASLEKNNNNLKNEIAKKVLNIKEMAYHDYLTGLPNRLSFYQNLNRIIDESNIENDIFSVLFIDLDNFKHINDTLGHSFGDELLKAVSLRLLGILKHDSLLSRNGGDEFTVVINNVKDEKDIKCVANRICLTLKEPFSINNEKIYITASIGIALYPFDGKDSESLVKYADIAMYRAKDCGKNCCVSCSSLLLNNYGERLNLTKDLYYVLEKKELYLMYQPQISSLNNSIIGMEALIRWKHPKLGVVSPSKFIPIAEKTGLILPIGKWVLKTACMQNKKWQEQGFSHFKISVNISVIQLLQGDIIQTVSSVLNETNLGPDFLELEVTENIAIKETEHILSILNSLKNLGVSIAIDDFGTGYSSLNYIKQLPVDRIKIDKEFISGIDTSIPDQAIAKTIITLGKSLNKSVLAEGVERIEELEFLTQNGCTEIQGYYYYKPLLPSTIETLLPNISNKT